MLVIRPSRERRRRRHHASGFTLVELMIVVVVIGVLASISFVGYRKYVAKARTAEVYTLLSEIAAKEHLYYLEFASYLPLRADDTATSITLNGNEAGTAFYPSNPILAGFDSARKAVSVSTSFPVEWSWLGVRPKTPAVYCTYMGNAGTPVDAPASAIGQRILGTAAVGTPWFYIVGACNLNGGSTSINPDAGNVSIFGLSSSRSTLYKANEDQ